MNEPLHPWIISLPAGRLCHTSVAQQMAADARQTAGPPDLELKVFPKKCKITNHLGDRILWDFLLIQTPPCAQGAECGRRAGEPIKQLASTGGCLPKILG